MKERIDDERTKEDVGSGEPVQLQLCSLLSGPAEKDLKNHPRIATKRSPKAMTRPSTGNLESKNS